MGTLGNSVCTSHRDWIQFDAKKAVKTINIVLYQQFLYLILFPEHSTEKFVFCGNDGLRLWSL